MLEKLNPLTEKISDVKYFKFVLLSLIFLLLTFDKNLAVIFILIALTDYVWFSTDKLISYPFERTKKNRVVILTVAGIAALVFLVSTSLILSAFTKTTYSIMSVIDILATTTPILAGNVILTFISFAILIPIIESSFFHGTLVEGLILFLERRTNIRINRYTINLGTILIAIVISSLFLLYHITAKDLANIPLAITFIFSMFAVFLTVKTREKKAAILMHIIINGIAMFPILFP